MADEINATIRMSVRKTSTSGAIILIDEDHTATFNMNMGDRLGPAPGLQRIPTTGKDIDLSELNVPGPCFIKNMDQTNFVTYGIKEPATGKFYPWGDLRPGEASLFRFSKYLGEEFIGIGTGTDPTPNTVHFMANTAAVQVYIGAYEYEESEA